MISQAVSGSCFTDFAVRSRNPDIYMGTCLGGNTSTPTPTLGSLQSSLQSSSHMPPNSHLPIIPTPPTPCDWGPAQGQGPGPGPGPGPGVGGWGTGGGGGGDNGNVATKRLCFERLCFEMGLSSGLYQNRVFQNRVLRRLEKRHPDQSDILRGASLPMDAANAAAFACL